MMQSSKSWILFVFPLIALVGVALAQTTVSRPRSGSSTMVAPPAQIIDKNKLDKKDIAILTPLELLDRIIKLEARAKAMEAKNELLTRENDDLKTRMKQIEWDFYRPGGQQGLKVRAMQKSLFDRIPGDAWIFFFTR